MSLGVINAVMVVVTMFMVGIATVGMVQALIQATVIFSHAVFNVSVLMGVEMRSRLSPGSQNQF